MATRVFLFGQSARDGRHLGNAQETSPLVLGSKGAGLAVMSSLKLPVPPGFTLSTAASAEYVSETRELAPALQQEVLHHLAAVEDAAGARFGDAVNPLLVSVRSGAPRSMPGMLDTVLNVGLNDATVAGLVRRTGDARFAWDSYRRFILSYADLVLGLDTQPFDECLRGAPQVHGAPDWQAITAQYLRLFEREAGTPFPQDVQRQLWAAISAVLDSWESRRARMYRTLHGVPDQPGIAVSIQAMVFGNAGNFSGTGVGFSRNPATGAAQPFGEYLANAQGGDVVSGVATPHSIASDRGEASLQEVMPEVYDALLASFRTLERHFGTVQDVEFTVERGKLWLLQTRPAVLSAAASVRVAVDMAAEQVISREDALRQADARQLTGLLHPAIAAHAPRTLLARGLPASPGAATGPVVFSAEEAELCGKRGQRPVLVLTDTQPRDVHGLHAAQAVLTSRGGATSHAAVIARGLGRPCVVGATEIRVDTAARRFVTRGREVRAGDTVTIDGTSGEIFLGSLPLQEPEVGPHLATLLGWADAVRGLEVRMNTETAADVVRGRSLGAQGVGLFRTEYTFLAEPALGHMRALVLSDGAAARRSALQALLALQRAAYVEVLRLAQGMPLALRLLDLPLSSFLPRADEDVIELARTLRTTPAEIRARGQSLEESNPGFGHRGCRLAVSWPDLYAMQVRGLLEAALDAEAGVRVQILVPLVSIAAEFSRVVADIARVAEDVRRERGAMPPYQVGAIIELPRAALQAGELARSAEVLSLGTNNLTQATLGFARDDAAAFLNRYRDRGLLGADPFVSLDIEGVGELVKTAIARARATRPDVEIGVCGEQAGDPASIEFFLGVGVDYVSVSPYRLPITRLAAAQAALSSKG